MNDLTNINNTELPLFVSLFDTEDGHDSFADTCEPKDYFNCSNIHETQWKTDVKELQHLKVDEQPYFNDTEHPLFFLLFDIKNDYDSIVDFCEPSDNFNQSDICETQKDILTVVEKPPYLDVLEDKFDYDDENTEESEPLYLVDNLVYITKVDSQHNHELVKNIDIVASHYCKLFLEIRDEVKILTASRAHAGAIIETIRHEKRVTSDAGSIYIELMKQKQDNPMLHIDTCFEGKDNHLEKGFGIMKKALNLAISTGRSEELYEMHSRLVNKMENEIAKNKG
ncbi:16036_t:CDS:2 [Cetraspora pellucida]|uniref:16036_t:CDS:1 n=1 Tax=Cetraspora pellucida TaxID=1433469 RepID=A0ACA9K7E0_9GLOM|nr:16036_t:CDS:2 [Cetraspora pellucida]